MLLPSPSAIRHARASLQRGLEEFTPGIVTIGGVAFQASVILGRAGADLDSGGDELIQPITVFISKTALPTQPSNHGGLAFELKNFTIVTVSQTEAHHTAWRIDGKRTVPVGE